MFIPSFQVFLYLPGASFAITGIANVVSAFLGETFVREPPESREQRGDGAPKPSSQRLRELRRMLLGIFDSTREQNQVASFVFWIMIIAVNLFVGITSLLTWIDIVKSLPRRHALSPFAPYAKMFGNLLDLNCALLLLPVCRTFIRYLYDLSTQSQTLSQQIMRALLYFVPLDKSLTLHRRVAWWVLVTSFGHTFFHLVNWAIAPDNTMSRFGLWPWISGVIIFFCMLLMYGSVTPSVKRSHFEIFW